MSSSRDIATRVFPFKDDPEGMGYPLVVACVAPLGARSTMSR